jgi:hypothetical protein
MDLKQIIEEIYDRGGGSYPAYSEAPRKDFAPMSGSKTGSYDYPYQQSGVAGAFTEPPPDAPIILPWPMQTVTDDLADGFVLVMTAANKIVQCVNSNPALTETQKEQLIDIYKKTRHALDLIKEVGLNIGKSNIAGPQPSQNPVPAPSNPAPDSLPDRGNTVVIKLP